MNWRQLVQTIDPAISDENADYFLWERTCFPMGGPRLVYSQLKSAVRASKNGIAQCELCSNKVEKWGDTCQRCDLLLARNRKYIADQEKQLENW